MSPKKLKRCRSCRRCRTITKWRGRNVHQSALLLTSTKHWLKVKALDTEPLQRILIFTTIKLLGKLTMAKRGSVDGMIRSCMRLWKQLFIVMVQLRGVFIPIAFCWLPDKSTTSYYATLFLLMAAFCEHSDEIQQVYGRTTLRLRKIKCDFEVGIHLGWQMFRISGCYFHYTQVCTYFSDNYLSFQFKAIWCKVQELGFVKAYMVDEKIRDFDRCYPVPSN